MLKKIFKRHLFAVLWFLLYIGTQLFVVIFGSIVALILDENFREIYFNGEVSKMNEAIYDKILSISISSMPVTAGIVIITFLLVLLIQKNVKHILKPIKKQVVIRYILIGLFLNLFLNLVISFLPVTKYIANLDDSVEIALSGSFGFVLISTGIMVPIMEEIIFRYGLCYNLSKVNEYYGLILSALIFGVMHGNLIQSSYAFVLGLIFGYVDMKENSLIPSIIMHVSINSLTVLMTFVNPSITIIIVFILFVVQLFSMKKFV